jgi:hypothetical protein
MSFEKPVTTDLICTSALNWISEIINSEKETNQSKTRPSPWRNKPDTYLSCSYTYRCKHFLSFPLFFTFFWWIYILHNILYFDTVYDTCWYPASPLLYLISLFALFWKQNKKGDMISLCGLCCNPKFFCFPCNRQLVPPRTSSVSYVFSVSDIKWTCCWPV